MTPNPDSVVALTTALLLGKVSTRADDIRTSIVSSISGIDNRTCAVLDALAALCVCEPKSEVIAIACRYKKPNTELIIAANNGPPSASTLKHLKSIWDSLSDISNRMISGKQLPTNPRVESPEFELKVLATLLSANSSLTSTSIVLRWFKSAMRSICLLWKYSKNSTTVGSSITNPWLGQP